MYGEEMTVQADFAFFDPKPDDFGSVKMLMNTYLDDYVWDVSGFVDLILQQTTVGSVIKLDDQDNNDGIVSEKNDDKEGDVFGVISALNLGRYAGHQCIQELKKYILKSCTDKSTKQKLKLKLEDQASDVGLLVSQRFVNCPHQLVPPFYDALFDEVSWATEDEPTEELRDSFGFKFYLLITKIYENKMVNKKVGGKLAQEEPIIYVKAEDEIFRELSSLSFTFDLHGEQERSGELKEYKAKGLAMVVKADDIPKFRTKLKSLLAEA